MLFGTDFDDKVNWAAEILQNSHLTDADKLDALRERRDAAVEKRLGAGV
jgi:hypothetical protein